MALTGTSKVLVCVEDGEGERGRGGEGLTNSPFEIGDKGSRSISIGEGSIPFWLCSVVRSGA